MFIKDCRVLFGDISIVPFLGSALGLTAMCSLGWGNLVAFEWNDLPMGREFDCEFLKKSNPHPMPCLPPSHRHYIDRCIICLLDFIHHWLYTSFYFILFFLAHSQWWMCKWMMSDLWELKHKNKYKLQVSISTLNGPKTSLQKLFEWATSIRSTIVSI